MLKATALTAVLLLGVGCFAQHSYHRLMIRLQSPIAPWLPRPGRRYEADRAQEVYVERVRFLRLGLELLLLRLCSDVSAKTILIAYLPRLTHQLPEQLQSQAAPTAAPP